MTHSRSCNASRHDLDACEPQGAFEVFTAMRWARVNRTLAWATATLAFTGAACLQGLVRTTIDLRSFLSPAIAGKSYSLPPDTPVIELQTDPRLLVISEKLQNIGQLEEAGASFQVVYSNGSGRAHTSVALHASDSAETLYQSAPLLDLTADLAPGDERTVEGHLDAAPHLLELIRDGRLYIGFRYRWASAGSDTVSGSYRITKLEVQVTSRMSNLLASTQSKLAQSGPN